jgi:two-component system response regulator CpxR
MSAAILIVDDEHELAQMLTEYLGGEGYETSVAPDGARALEMLASRRPDRVILDVMLPELNGFDVLKKLRQSLTVPVIMLTARGSDVDRIVGLELGADDYLAKPFNPRELVARIRAVLRRLHGDVPTAPQAALAVGALRIDPATLEVRVRDREIRVTGTEFRVLELLMRGAGQVQSRDTLTERALGRRLSPYDRSIDTHVSNLRRKLGLEGADLPEIRGIRGAGYMLTAPGTDAA